MFRAMIGTFLITTLYAQNMENGKLYKKKTVRNELNIKNARHVHNEKTPLEKAGTETGDAL